MSAAVALSAIGLAASAVALVHAKVKISAVLVHHATHGKGLEDRRGNRLMAEALSAIALTMPFEEYKRVHEIHHRTSTFAGMCDEEAVFLYGLGFRRGSKREDLWKTFWATMFSPRFHATQSVARLGANFVQGSPLRVAGVWGLWASLLAAAVGADVLPGLVLGVVAPVMVGGNIGSFLELVSRHRWMVSAEPGRPRQLDLSHGRFTAPMPPDAGSAWEWAKWGFRVAVSTLARLTVVPTDLGWHIAHHAGLKRPQWMKTPAWTDAASAYSWHLYRDQSLAYQSYPSILAAADAWFTALEMEAP